MKKIFVLALWLVPALLSLASCCKVSTDDPAQDNPAEDNPAEDNDSGTESEEDVIVDLASEGTANCYIVSSAGSYVFPAVKGNSSDAVRNVSTVKVLWETVCTDIAPQKGDLISDVIYEGGKIYFNTNPDFRKGNASIAVKDPNGRILWSWHIWMTDQPKDQIYKNNAGTMMDRNLGAISATPGDAGALGLLFQWGRKDPFLGSSSISENVHAESTRGWPYPADMERSPEAMAYSIENPTTFIRNFDFRGSIDDVDITWRSTKTIYDPCPPGYRVPDGGEDGIWRKAIEPLSSLTADFDSINVGFDFGSYDGDEKKLTEKDEICWYPLPGTLAGSVGSLSSTGNLGFLWTCDLDYSLHWPNVVLVSDGSISIVSFYPSEGASVRCQKE